MLTYKAFTILLILFGAPGTVPTVVRTFNEAETFEECNAKAQGIAADDIWKHPVGASASQPACSPADRARLPRRAPMHQHGPASPLQSPSVRRPT